MHVFFSLNLDKYIAEDSADKGTIYDLYGVVNHRGELYFGHCKSELTFMHAHHQMIMQH